MPKKTFKLPIQISHNEATVLLFAMMNAIKLYRDPKHPFDDSLQDLFAGFLHLNSDSRLFVDPVEQLLFDKIMPLSEPAFDELFQFCLNYFSSDVQIDIEQYFGLTINNQFWLRNEQSNSHVSLARIHID